jgi:hypothetical protein
VEVWAAWCMQEPERTATAQTPASITNGLPEDMILYLPEREVSGAPDCAMTEDGGTSSAVVMRYGKGFVLR